MISGAARNVSGGMIYFEGQKEIYNASLEVIYTLKERESVYSSAGNGLIIKTTNDNGYSYSFLDANGTTEFLMSYSSSNSYNPSLSTYGSYLCITNSSMSGTTYTYYNADGEEIYTSNTSLSRASIYAEDYALFSTYINGEIAWYVFE